MEDNEDEPEDVRKATPVADDIKAGSKDETAGNAKATGKKKDGSKPSRCDKNPKKPSPAKSEADCCRGRTSKPSKSPKTMSVLVYSPPCNLPRLEIIPRHCLSKQEYIDVLAAPSQKCPPPCLGKTVVRKVRPISTRMNELAQPARRLIVSTLQERGELLPPEMINNLVKSIEGSACMTPEQAEQYFRDKERSKEQKGVKDGKKKCKGKSKKDNCPSQLDKEAVMCQYLMAERFVKSILQWKCPIPVEEFQDIASVILRRLSFVLEYTLTDGQDDLKAQQMRFLADIIACWISGVLFEVADEHKEEIEQEKLAQEEEEEGKDEEDEDEDEEGKKHVNELGETEEEDEDDDEGEGKQKDLVKDDLQGPGGGKNVDERQEPPVVVKPEPQDYDNEDTNYLADREKEEQEAKERERLEAEKRKKKIEEEEENARREAEERERLEAEKKKKKQEEEEEEARRKKQKEEEEEARKEKEAEEKRRQKEAEETRKREEAEEEEARKQKQAEKEEEEKRRKEEDEERRKKEAEMKKKKEEEDRLMALGPKKAIDGIGDGELFKTDLPFVTFGRILDTVYNMVEDEPEGDETDLIHNRIQRAIYEKFSRLVEAESPKELTENLKDVIDVLSGKAATWIQRLLKDSEVRFMNANPPEVESKEIRDWGRWIDQVTNKAGDWANWIHRVVKEAETKSSAPKSVNRGDWQDWTSDTERNALLWRRYYLETVHQAHHNKMMVADRPVVKTGEKGAHSTTEEEIKNTDLAVV